MHWQKPALSEVEGTSAPTLDLRYCNAYAAVSRIGSPFVITSVCS
jgi:hypothetical protein